MLWFCFLAAASSQPAPDSEDVFSILEEQKEVMVSVGSRTEEKLSEAASSVWVITREDIESSAAQNLGDLLARIPGFAILNTTDGESEIIVRGYGNEIDSHVLILVDNRVVESPVGSSFLSDVPVSLYDIERIEVLIGPASTLYGANAYSGVINIITKKPIDKGFQVTGVLDGGAKWSSVGGNTPTAGKPGALLNGFASYTQRLGEFGLRLSTGGDFLDAPSLEPAGPSAPYAADPAPATSHWTANGDLTFSHAGWESRLQVSSVYTQSSLFESNGRSDGSVQSQAVNIEVEKNDIGWRGDRLTLQAWVKREVYTETGFIPGVGSVPADLTSYQEELFALYALPELWHNRIVVGFEGRFIETSYGSGATGDGILPAGRFTQLFGLFAEDQFQPWRFLHFVLGARVDDFESSAWSAFSRTEFSPHVAVVALLAAGHNIRAEFSTAFRNPSVVETFLTNSLFNGEVVALEPNTHLRAEEHQLFSLGYQGQFAWFHPRVEGFYGVRKNGIETTVLVPGTSFPNAYENIFSEDYYGASTYAEAVPIAALKFFAHYTFTQVRNQNPTFVFADSPRHVGGFGVSLTLGRFEASAQLYGQTATVQTDGFSGAAYAVAGQLTLNARAGYWLDAKKRWQIFAAGTNLSDYRPGGVVERDIASFNTVRVGPRIWAGVRFAFAR